MSPAEVDPLAVADSPGPAVSDTKPSAAARNAARAAVALLALAALILVARRAGGYIPQFAQWVDGLGLLGPLVFVLGYAVATVAFIPGSLLTLAAGAIFGLAQGTLYSFVGASLGAIGAFLVARYFARAAIERRLEAYPRFEAVDRAVGVEGRKIVFLLRLSPAFPFVLLNYALGLTRVRLADYALACFGMIPGTLLYVYYGKVVGDVAALAAGAAPERGTAHWVVLGLGLVATLVVTTIVTRIASRALRQATEGDSGNDPPGETPGDHTSAQVNT
jgi:uncharacterized membrane protein YdjX (TVP38/TMEM64 family)